MDTLDERVHTINAPGVRDHRGLVNNLGNLPVRSRNREPLLSLIWERHMSP